MSTTKSINVSASRFSALKIENDDDEDGFQEIKSKSNKKNANNGKSSATNGTTNNNSNKNKKKTHKSNSANKNTKSESEDWTIWKKKDEEFADDLYKEELKKALLDSKVDFEMQNQKKSNPNDANQKNKPKPMSLEEFHNGSNNKSHVKERQNDLVIQTEDFMEEIEKKVENMIIKEKAHVDIDDKHVIEKFLSLQYKEEIETRDKQIEDLKKEVLDCKEEIIQVKRRNKQLAFILGQGEMKEKSELLIQIEELSTARDDLTAQISELNKHLEQEKSKVHLLENEYKRSTKKH